MPLHVAGLRARHVRQDSGERDATARRWPPPQKPLSPVIARVTTCRRGSVRRSTAAEPDARRPEHASSSRLAPRRRRGGARGSPAAGAGWARVFSRRAHGAVARSRPRYMQKGACAPWSSSWAYLWPVGRSVSLSAFPRCALAHRTTGGGITESERLAGPGHEDESVQLFSCCWRRASCAQL